MYNYCYGLLRAQSNGIYHSLALAPSIAISQKHLRARRTTAITIHGEYRFGDRVPAYEQIE